MLSEQVSAHIPLAVGNATLSDWLALLKPRVLLLVVYTGVIGLVIAPGHLPPFQSLMAIACITGAAGACGAINMWYDRDIDRLMRRTRNRPIAAGRVSPAGGLWFGIVLAAASVAAMWATVNGPAAAALAFSAFFYIFIYTIWLKRRTPQNIVIGGAAGALPPVIAWAAATGSIGPTALVLFGIIFIWTPPHFWSLALWANEDYRVAGVPMLPVVAGARVTRLNILGYTILMVPFTTLPYFMGAAGPIYLAAALVLGALFLWHAWQVMRDKQDETGVSLTGDQPAKKAFKYSVLYLFVLFGALAVDHWVMHALA
ncbi:MAG TPA: heme o synthase [Rhodopila sp.]|uniref:heme o synthase n=1 Tax=Rhodopila sp. TaxID=2480087 RepID=UPI002C48EE60|nr:heme o synthase [Rhodopila sp.]HVY14730.1 heme o synthase [Rhodopila sp.]